MKTNVFTLLCTAAFAFATSPWHAAGAEVASVDVRQTEHIYKTIGDTQLTIHRFNPAAAPTDGSRAAMVLIHGGGWAFGKPEEFFPFCRRYAGLGLVTFSVEYRLAENAEGTIPSPKLTPIECVKDVRSAVRWVRGHAAEFGIDPNRIVVGGHSVGGQLALATVLCDTINEASDDPALSPVPNALLLYSGTPDTMEAWCDYLLADRRAQIWSISPAHNVRPDMPPAIAFHGREDHVVPFWKVTRLHRFMEKAGNTFELHAYDGRGHYLAAGDETYAGIVDDEILAKTDAFLRQRGFLGPP